MKAFKKIMLVIIVSVFCLWTAQAGASLIPTLYNTGIPGAGGVDAHYQLVVNPNDATTNAYVVTDDKWPVAGPTGTNRPWIANSSTSKWIAPLFISDDTKPYVPVGFGYVSNAVGTYTYRTTFDLTGFNPATATIAGKWWVDNYRGGIFLNGSSTSIYTPIINDPDGLQQDRTFTINSALLHAGVNYLDFVVVNQDGPNYGNPSGLRVEFTSKDANPVPLPPAVWLLGSGLLGLSYIRRKIKN